MSGRDVAWTTAAATGLGCAVAAGLAVWLLLTDPLTVTGAVGAHNLSALGHAAYVAFRDIAFRLLR